MSRSVTSLALVSLLVGPVAAAGQSSGPLFARLLADPREPGFFATYLWGRSHALASRLGAVGLGQTIGVGRSQHWELALAAGVFSQFNMGSPTNDLINTDYRVGLPVTYRRGALATRLQIYHQSSHLGDEYLLHTGAKRVDLTFESAELIVSHDATRWRVYGGGEYAFKRSPSDLKPAVVRAGLEYRGARPAVHVGHLAAGRLVAGLDVASIQVRDWEPAWSLVGGFEMATPGAAPGSGWEWSILLTAYTGPTPYGQFYRDPLSSVGIGIAFAR